MELDGVYSDLSLENVEFFHREPRKKGGLRVRVKLEPLEIPPQVSLNFKINFSPKNTRQSSGITLITTIWVHAQMKLIKINKFMLLKKRRHYI